MITYYDYQILGAKLIELNIPKFKFIPVTPRKNGQVPNDVPFDVLMEGTMAFINHIHYKTHVIIEEHKPCINGVQHVTEIDNKDTREFY